MMNSVRTSSPWMVLLSGLVLTWSAISCERAEVSPGGGEPSKGDSYGSGSKPDRGGVPAALRTGKVEFRNANGFEQFYFKPKGSESVKLYDRSGQERCKLTFGKDRLKVKDASDRALFELKAKGEKVMLKDAGGESELFKFKLKGDVIDFYVSGSDAKMYRIKKKEYGYALENAAGETVFRAKEKDGKIVLRNVQEQTVLSTKDVADPLCLVFFRLEPLSLEQQAACSAFFLQRVTSGERRGH